jgi:hypothetical protein
MAALVTFALLAPPESQAGEQVPFKGRDCGPTYVASVDFGLGVVVLFGDAQGHSTLLGRHFARTTIIVDLVSGAILSVSTTFYAPNGDSITDVLNEILATPDPLTIVSRSSIVSGTGRFEGVQGHFETTSRYDDVPILENLPVNSTNVWSGVISSPGSNRRVVPSGPGAPFAD